jgi:hypothetical protein
LYTNISFITEKKLVKNQNYIYFISLAQCRGRGIIAGVEKKLYMHNVGQQKYCPNNISLLLLAGRCKIKSDNISSNKWFLQMLE